MKALIKCLVDAGLNADLVIKQMTLVDEALVLKINNRLTTKFPEAAISKILQTLNGVEEANGILYYAVETGDSEGHVFLVEFSGHDHWEATLEEADDNESPGLIEALINVLEIESEDHDEASA